MLKSNKGFSLVELMVVVAIIGILAAIAIPNFQRFSAKSKQSEAKADMSALYSAERAFSAEWQTYYGQFEVVGYAPVGDYRYQHGFPANGGTIPPNYTGPAATGADFATTTYCAQNAAVNANGCAVVWTTALGGGVPGVAPTVAAFTIGARGDIGNATTNDQWTMDQNKVLSNTANGLP